MATSQANSPSTEVLGGVTDEDRFDNLLNYGLDDDEDDFFDALTTRDEEYPF